MHKKLLTSEEADSKVSLMLLDMTDKDVLENQSILRTAFSKKMTSLRMEDYAGRRKSSARAAITREIRDNRIIDWAKRNLKVGDIVKVVGSSHMKFRIVETIEDGYFTGRHCSVDRYKITRGDYITDHYHKKIRGLVIFRSDQVEPYHFYSPINNLMDQADAS